MRLTILRASQDLEDAFSTLVQQEALAAALVHGESSLTRGRNASFAADKGGVASLIKVLDATVGYSIPVMARSRRTLRQAAARSPRSAR